MKPRRIPLMLFAVLSPALWQCLGSNDGVKPEDCEADPFLESGGRPADADLQHCADAVNGYRDSLGLSALARSPTIEAFAAVGACWDAYSQTPHSHFSAKRAYQLTDAENELPGWPLRTYRSITAILDQGTRQMWNEGPGTGDAHGHYNNIIGDHASIGCGIYIAADSTVWVIQDFK